MSIRYPELVELLEQSTSLDAVHVVTRSTTVTEQKKSIRAACDGDLVKIDLGFLDQLHWADAWHTVRVTPAQAEYLAALLIEVASAARSAASARS